MAGITGDIDETFDKLDVDGDGTVDIKELKYVLTALQGFPPSPKALADAMATIDVDGYVCR